MLLGLSDRATVKVTDFEALLPHDRLEPFKIDNFIIASSGAQNLNKVVAQLTQTKKAFRD